MSPVTDTMPPATKAELLRRVLAMKYPKLEKAPLAAHFNLTLGELHTLLNHHGYPNEQAMRRHMLELQEQAEAPEPSHNLPETDEHEPSTELTDTEAQPAAQDSIGQLTRVKLTRLLADPRNLRDQLPDIDELAQTIKEAGMIHPIIVRTEGQNLVVVDGHRRLAALRLLRHDVAEVIIRPSMRTADVLAAMLITAGQRSDLDPIEEARGLMRLKIERGDCTDAELATVVGRTQPFVSGRLALLNLTPEQQAEVRAGNMKLVEATHHGRMNAGKVSTKGQSKNWHLGPQHTLSNRVKARCTQAGHLKGRTVGGMGCGACWEAVIRADERVNLARRAIEKGTCDTCGSVTSPATEGVSAL